jgi:hypothetical protein
VVYRVVLALALFILLLPGLTAFNGCSLSSEPAEPGKSSGLRAAIIDQLNPSNPDPDFINRISAVLQKNGFTADYFSAEQITVDLYRRLPAQGYSLIIFRAHAGLLGNGQKADQKTCIFTNQPYSQKSEVAEQLFDRVVKAGVDEEPPLFGIGADFVNRSMHGRFEKTTVIMMGCSSFEKDDLARAFIKRGASAYVGWSTEVCLYFVEDVTAKLLEEIFESESLETAVRSAMQEKGTDPETGAELKLYQ